LDDTSWLRPMTHLWTRVIPAFAQILSLNSELRLAATARCHQGAPVSGIRGLDLEIMNMLDLMRHRERVH
jgi:hypothetical protein